MSPLKIVVISSVVAVVCTAGGLYRRQQAKAGELGWLRGQSSQLRLKARELARAAPAPTPRTPEAASVAASAAPTDRAVVHEEYRNDGRATARAALQTLAWCCDRADVEALKSLVQPEPEARAKAEAFYTSLPADGRGQWKSADEMVASFVMLAAQASPFPSADVLDAAAMEAQGDDLMRLRLPGTRKDRLPFRRGADGNWSCVVDARTMDGLLAMAKELATSAR